MCTGCKRFLIQSSFGPKVEYLLVHFLSGVMLEVSHNSLCKLHLSAILVPLPPGMQQFKQKKKKSSSSMFLTLHWHMLPSPNFHFTSSGLSWLTRCAPWSSTILAAGRSLSARRFAWHNCAIISYLHSYYVSQVKWYHSLNIISAVRETNLPWITEIRKPADRIASNSFVVMLWVQHALTCPSKPQLDCIPVEDMPFTYSWKQRSTELQMSLPRISCQMYVIFISACTSVWL